MQIDTFKEIFTANKGLYPSLSQFLNDAKEKLDKEYKRNDAMKWYNAQEIVQVFAPPPIIEALKRKKGFYPKIISFAPFERLYVDTGSISIFKYTRKQEKQMEKKKNKIAVDVVVPSPPPTIIEEPSPLPKEEPSPLPKEEPINRNTDGWNIRKNTYSNRGKQTARIIFKKGNQTVIKEKHFGNTEEDIKKSIKWLQDNFENPFFKATNKDDFIQEIKNKRKRKGD
jgi:hypothetical protein